MAGEERPDPRRRSDGEVAAVCAVIARTVARVCEAVDTDGFAVALRSRPHPGAAPSPAPEQERRVVALACSPQAGRWTVWLLAARVVELEALPLVGRELVRATLKYTASSRGGCGGG